MHSDREAPEDSRGLAELAEAAPALLWTTGPTGAGEKFNAAWGEITGLAPGELSGQTWLETVHPEDRAAFVTASAAQGTSGTAFRVRDAAGIWRWFRDCARTRRDAAGEVLDRVHVAVEIADAGTAADVFPSATQPLAEARSEVFGTYDWDLGSGEVVLSPELLRLYGIAPETPPEAVHAAWLERIHPEDRARVEEEAGQFAEGGDATASDFRVVLPGGEVRWIEGRGRVLRDAEGRALRMIGVNLDATERRRNEVALRESEARLRSLAENFPGVIFQRVTYPDGRIEYPYSAGAGREALAFACERLAGAVSIEEVAELIHYEDLDEMLARFRHAAEKLLPLELEGRLVSDGVTRAWVRSLSRPRPRGDGALVWDGVLLDVTEQRAQESERDRAATALGLAIEVAGIGTWDFDPETRAVTASSVTNALFGLPADGEARPNEAYLERVHPEDVALILARLDEARASAGPVAYEYRLLGPTGPRWIASRGAMVRMADGRSRIIGALSDVTDRRRREEEREAALRRQRALLRELNHRIKNNLQMITSVLRLQSRLEGGGHSPNFLRALDRVQTISDLHARLGPDGDLGPIDFGGYLSDVCEKARLAAEEKGVAVGCDVEPCRLDMDRAVPLGIIVNELTANALLHGFSGGRGGRLWVKLAEAGEEVRLEIGHNGAAAAADQPKGLGLQLVEGLLRQIGARRRLEGGAVHVVSLPLERG